MRPNLPEKFNKTAPLLITDEEVLAVNKAAAHFDPSAQRYIAQLISHGIVRRLLKYKHDVFSEDVGENIEKMHVENLFAYWDNDKTEIGISMVHFVMNLIATTVTKKFMASVNTTSWEEAIFLKKKYLPRFMDGRANVLKNRFGKNIKFTKRGLLTLAAVSSYLISEIAYVSRKRAASKDTITKEDVIAAIKSDKDLLHFLTPDDQQLTHYEKRCIKDVNYGRHAVELFIDLPKSSPKPKSQKKTPSPK